MQTISFLRALVPLACAVLLAACSAAADNPYARIKDAPLVRASLHTVTLVSADAAVVGRVRQDGYSPLPPAPNYPGAVRVEAALWKVPEDVASQPLVFMAPRGRGPNVRVLTAPLAGELPEVDSAVIEAFYRNVLGTAVPQWPGSISLPSTAKVRAWTFLIDNVVEARRRLREAGIPVTFDAVAITTAYLGDHKLLGIMAPDGVIIELVETAAH
jgi:hypothetical protein